MELNIKIPEKYFASDKKVVNKKEATQQFKLYGTLMMYQLGKISAGMACEIMEINRFDFLEYCKKFNIPIITYSINDIQEDLEGLI